MFVYCRPEVNRLFKPLQWLRESTQRHILPVANYRQECAASVYICVCVSHWQLKHVHYSN